MSIKTTYFEKIVLCMHKDTDSRIFGHARYTIGELQGTHDPFERGIVIECISVFSSRTQMLLATLWIIAGHKTGL